MPAAPVTQQLLTAEEFMKLPDPADGSLQELVQGVVVTIPPPKGRHGVCCLRVGRLVGNFVDQHKLGHTASNDAGVILRRGPDTVRGPDIAYYSRTRVPEVPDGYFEVPPDLVIEVVSPDDQHSKVQAKVRQYLKAGVAMVWLVDPDLRIVTAYRPGDRMRTSEEADTLDGEDVLPGFSCQVADLFA